MRRVEPEDRVHRRVKSLARWRGTNLTGSRPEIEGWACSSRNCINTYRHTHIYIYIVCICCIMHAHPQNCCNQTSVKHLVPPLSIWMRRRSSLKQEASFWPPPSNYLLSAGRSSCTTLPKLSCWNTISFWTRSSLEPFFPRPSQIQEDRTKRRNCKNTDKWTLNGLTVHWSTYLLPVHTSIFISISELL